MRTRIVGLALALGLALLAAACVVGPDYRRPALSTPDQYRGAPAATPAEPAVHDDWWTLFGDPGLERLVAVALAESADLRIAAARVEEARALAGVTRSRRFPEVTAGFSADRSKVSEETTPLPPGSFTTLDRRRASIDVSHGLDFWGRLRRLTEAAEADLLATAYGADAVRLDLVSEVVRGWFELHTFDRQLEIARATGATRKEGLELQQLRFDSGIISQLDLSQARAELAAANAAVPELEQAAAETENRLSVLIGRNPESIDRRTNLEGFALPPEVPPGLPSSLLARRPDIAAAEQRLVAANARIGAAKAAYFPTIALTGQFGTESTELSGLLASGSTIWRAAASLVAPVFNAGRTKREVEVARAREVQALESYRKTLLTAFAEVEDALSARRTARERLTALADGVEALDHALELARLRYEGGQSSYLEVLDAQRSLFSAQLGLAAARRAELDAAAALFEALGGGWRVEGAGL